MSIIPRKLVPVAKIIYHPDYYNITRGDDIAMIKLSNAVDLNVYTPACLSNHGDDFTGMIGMVYGKLESNVLDFKSALFWGCGNINSWHDSQELLQVEVPIVSASACTAVADEVR